MLLLLEWGPYRRGPWDRHDTRGRVQRRHFWIPPACLGRCRGIGLCEGIIGGCEFHETLEWDAE